MSNSTIRETKGRKVFNWINRIILALICLVIIIPIWNVLITSVAVDRDVNAAVNILAEAKRIMNRMEQAKDA